MASNPLLGLSAPALAKLRAALAGGALSYGVNESSLRKVVPEISADCVSYLVGLAVDGWTAAQIGELVRGVCDARESGVREALLFDLVISGPEHEAVPTRDTAAVFRELVQGADREVILASFAIYNGKEIFQPLVERIQQVHNLEISLYLDIPRGRNDTTLSEQLVAKYRHDFVSKQWPSPQLPRLFYYKPSLEMDWKLRASMHAKVVIIDRKRAFISSANLTKAAHSKNIEVGTLLESSQLASRLADYFEGMRVKGVFQNF